jgi:hypothetical protein
MHKLALIGHSCSARSTYKCYENTTTFLCVSEFFGVAICCRCSHELGLCWGCAVIGKCAILAAAEFDTTCRRSDDRLFRACTFGGSRRDRCGCGRRRDGRVRAPGWNARVSVECRISGRRRFLYRLYLPSGQYSGCLKRLLAYFRGHESRSRSPYLDV